MTSGTESCVAIILTLDALPLAGRDPVLVGRLEPFGGVLAAIKAAMQLMGQIEQFSGSVISQGLTSPLHVGRLHQ